MREPRETQPLSFTGRVRRLRGLINNAGDLALGAFDQRRSTDLDGWGHRQVGHQL